MASEQIEEHLAEYLSNQVERTSAGTSRSQVVNAFDAFDATLEKELPAIAEDDPDYFLKGMMVTFEALHILWKSLATWPLNFDQVMHSPRSRRRLHR